MPNSFAAAMSVPKTLRIVILGVVLWGIILRFSTLDTKVYTFDETITSLRAAGYTRAEFVQFFYAKVHPVDEVYRYQSVDPKKHLTAVLRSLALEDPQHPPVYYVLENCWSRLFGNTIAARRSLSALFGVLLIPCVFWLCLELFAAPQVPWIAAGLVSISPFQVLYSDLAREYSLWALITVVSSALLLRAIHRSNLVTWALYAASLLLGLYTFLFFLYVIIAHGLYVVVTQVRSRPVVLRWLIAFAISVAAYIPWLRYIVAGWNKVLVSTGWFAITLPLKIMAIKWAFNVSTVFFDLVYLDPRFVVVSAVVLIIVAVALYSLIRATPVTVWLFVVALISVNALGLLFRDLVLGEAYSTQARYLVPVWLGVQLAVAYFLSAVWFSNTGPKRVAKLSQVWLILVFGSLAVAASIGPMAREWWIDVDEAPMLSVFHAVSRPQSALILTSDDLKAMELTNLLEEAGRNRISVGVAPPLDYNRFQKVFILNPTAAFIKELARTYHVRIVPVPLTFEQGTPMLQRLRRSANAARLRSGVHVEPISLWRFEREPAAR